MATSPPKSARLIEWIALAAVVVGLLLVLAELSQTVWSQLRPEDQRSFAVGLDVPVTAGTLAPSPAAPGTATAPATLTPYPVATSWATPTWNYADLGE
jgi:hypothetical protein